MCLTPYVLKDQQIPVQCGKCPECKSRRVSGWSFRLMQQSKVAMSAQFITLTYDTKNVPITKNGFMTLDKRDVQLYHKRLRKAHGEVSNIRYYIVGEYGGKTMRPHYHGIYFNARIECFQDAWNMGSIHYGEVNGASIGYALKYMCKEPKIPVHKNDDRQKEFALMSKRLGANYLTEAMIKWHKADLENRMYISIEDGKKISMPRYYKDKIYTNEERDIIAYESAKRAMEKMINTQGDRIERDGESWEYILEQYIAKEFKKMFVNAEKNRKL